MRALALALVVLAAASTTAAPPPPDAPLAPFALLVNRNLDESWVWLINNGGGCPETPKDLQLCSGSDCAKQKQRSGWKVEGGLSPWPPYVGGRRSCNPAIFERVPFAPDTPTLTLRSNGRVLGEANASAIRAALACT